VSDRPRIAVLDYGMGNLRSVEKAVERAGAVADVTRDADRARSADGLVLPGVGAFPKAMERIGELGLDELVRDRVAAGTPLLGICLGMQLLFDSSTEVGGARGLGLLQGAVGKLDAPGLKIPQIAWNHVAWRRPSAILEGLPSPAAMYHVHSYAPRPERAEDVLGTAAYGTEFVSAVERAPVYGVQFHPEKSGRHGLRMLGNFCGIAAAAPAPAT
jgi:imidazole glycerol-phosphate synthase subunit HisH